MRLGFFNGRTVAALLLAVTTSTLSANDGAASDTVAGSERVPLDEVLDVSIDPDLDPKRYWQERYAKLLRQRAVEERVIEAERELYADANRRNYRRGTKRHLHRDAMLEAVARKGEVEDRLVKFREEARRAGVLPGWLYEVEGSWQDAPIVLPAVAAETREAPADEDERAGRNPIHLDDESGE